MVQLFTSFACDFCEPPAGAVVVAKKRQLWLAMILDTGLEPNAPDYRRVLVECSSTDTEIPVKHTYACAQFTWGTVRLFCLMDAETEGSPLCAVLADNRGFNMLSGIALTVDFTFRIDVWG
jgi:hypothetical protein